MEFSEKEFNSCGAVVGIALLFVLGIGLGYALGTKSSATTPVSTAPPTLSAAEYAIPGGAMIDGTLKDMQGVGTMSAGVRCILVMDDGRRIICDIRYGHQLVVGKRYLLTFNHAGDLTGAKMLAAEDELQLDRRELEASVLIHKEKP